MTGARKFSTVFVALMATMMMSVPSTGFMIRPSARVITQLHLEDWVAEMIDQELYRQGHKKEFEAEWMEKNRAAVFHRFEVEMQALENTDENDFRSYQRDKKLAMKDPERYCADRCIATGNCDVFQDFYKLGPEDVIKFCTDCVLSDEEGGECELPEKFYDGPTP